MLHMTYWFKGRQKNLLNFLKAIVKIKDSKILVLVWITFSITFFILQMNYFLHVLYFLYKVSYARF